LALVNLHRGQRRWLSAGLIVALLFMQLATAAYACPRERERFQPSQTAAEMPGCDGNMPLAMDADQPQLCKAHCEQGSHVVNTTEACDATTPPMVVAVLDWAHSAVAPTSGATPRHRSRSGLSPPGSPPLYLSLLVLRI
jgi:hypothetical protein